MSEDVKAYGNAVNPELRACPFCGFSMTEVVQMGVRRYVQCGDCGAQGPWTKDETSAIAMWNKRERDKLRAVRRSGGAVAPRPAQP